MKVPVNCAYAVQQHALMLQRKSQPDFWREESAAAAEERVDAARGVPPVLLMERWGGVPCLGLLPKELLLGAGGCAAA